MLSCRPLHNCDARGRAGRSESQFSEKPFDPGEKFLSRACCGERAGAFDDREADHALDPAEVAPEVPRQEGSFSRRQAGHAQKRGDQAERVHPLFATRMRWRSGGSGWGSEATSGGRGR